MKKLLALVLAAIMALSVLPMTAFADGEHEYNTVEGTAYISISSDDKYVTSDGTVSGKIMAYIPVDLSKLSDIKLEDYDLADFYYDKDQDGKDEITLLLLYIYVLNTYYSGTAKELEITGSLGSMYMKNGFWGHDENLTYYVNGSYPLVRVGWGATADQIVLSDGDFVDVSMYSSWNFYGDDKAGYHYFEENGDITHEYTVKKNEPLTIKYTRAWGNLNIGGATERVASVNSTIYYGKNLYNEETANTVTTDENGEANITFDKGGVYYLWAYGEYGTEESGCEDDIVSSPSYCKVVVEGGAGSEIVYGDVNGDGKVNLFDVIALIRHYNGVGTELSTEQLKAADVTGDGKVNLFDVIEMIRYYNGVIDKFSAEK